MDQDLKPDGVAGGARAARGRGRGVLLVLATAVLITLAIGSTLAALLVADGQLRQGRDALQRGATALTRGDPSRASRAFADAAAAFARSGASLDEPIGRISSLIPILGRNVDVADQLARAGLAFSLAGRDLSSALSRLPNGIGTLAPHDGSIPVEEIARFADVLSTEEDAVTGALGGLERSPDSLLFPPVANARNDAIEAVRSASQTLSTLSDLSGALPSFAGSSGLRRYFFGAATPAEQRGTGGLVGAYSILTLQDGALRFSRFRATNTLTDLAPGKVPPPNPDYRRNYDQYGGAGNWQNMNMTPDFPSAARAVEATYRLDTGHDLDGVIVADPSALQLLLHVTGPTKIPFLGTRVSAADVVAFTEYRAYSLFKTAAVRKRVLGEVAAGVVDRFLRIPGHGLERLRALAAATQQGHLLIYADDSQMESALERAGVGGSMTVPPGDMLSVVVNSASGSKVDYWAYRQVSYRIRLEDGGSGTAVTDVRIDNDAPTSGAPRYVLGPFPGEGLGAGDNRSLVSIYCAPGCRGFGPQRNGRPIPVRTGSELGYPWFQDFVTIGSDESSSFHLGTTLPDVWRGDDRGGTYVLTFLDQTTTRPTNLSIAISAPPDMNITSTSPSMDVNGRTATWEGVPSHVMRLEVSFSPPLTVRLWRSVTSLLR
jgi:hypothetical protein